MSKIDSHPTVIKMKDIDKSFLFGTKLIFQPMKSKGINTIFHFSFKRNDNINATITIKEQKLIVENGLIGKPNLLIISDSEDWIKFLNGKLNLFFALITFKIRLKGNIKHLIEFSKCFPIS